MMCHKVCLAALMLRCCGATLFSNVVARAVESTGDNSALMLVAGISAQQEMCLVASNGVAFLEACTSAMASGDGHEVWSLQSGGQMQHLNSKMCASAATADPGERLELVDCNAAKPWALLPNGQVQVGDQCLSQAGQGADAENLAVGSAVQATSSAEFVQHGAGAAIDSDAASFWASKFDESTPVTLSLDLGESRNIDQVQVEWAYPPLSFSIETSVDGLTWVEVFETSVNMVSVSRVDAGLVVASRVRIVMREPHPLYGNVAGHTLYGVRSLSVFAPGLRTVLADCAIAAQSTDARDKYFASYVPALDTAPSAALQAALPALDAAKASLSSTLSEVAATFPKLPECGSKTAAMVHLQVRDTTRTEARESLGSADGLDEFGVRLLLSSAKVTIRGLREALK